MHYIAKTNKVQKNKLIQAKQGTQACYVKINMDTLNYKTMMCNTKHIKIFLVFKKKFMTKTKSTHYAK